MSDGRAVLENLHPLMATEGIQPDLVSTMPLAVSPHHGPFPALLISLSLMSYSNLSTPSLAIPSVNPTG